MTYPAVADIDLDAFAANLARVREASNAPHLMAIVKADAYGHGRVKCAQVAIREGADYLGVAQLGEALTLRQELRQEIGADPRIMAWIYAHDTDLAPALEADIDLSIGSFATLDAIEKAARTTGKTARIHLKVDTAMVRGGFDLDELPDAAARIRALEDAGLVQTVGLWSHLARADEPESDLTATQVGRFEQARTIVAQAGLDIELHHLAASAGTLWHPNTHYDMVRPGIALYGLSPDPAVATASELGLKAVMTLSAPLIRHRDVPAGTGISYGHTAHTETDQRLGLVPLGYADGISRSASNVAPLVVAGERTKIIGRVCMDQFVVPILPEATEGERAWLFGDAAAGLPTADEWAQAMGTIGYELVTQIGVRVPRNYVSL